ncbi:MAG: glycine-rich protein, partial [Candidatus Omnitrophica bacterium]|nr:glycine-rich protein [Candidatus Omnitrophota bacterium]
MNKKLLWSIIFLLTFFSLCYNQQVSASSISQLPNADSTVTLKWINPGGFSFTALETGLYHIQCWGAGGGSSGLLPAPAGGGGGGGGSYVSGDINIDSGVE